MSVVGQSLPIDGLVRMLMLLDLELKVMMPMEPSSVSQLMIVGRSLSNWDRMRRQAPPPRQPRLPPSSVGDDRQRLRPKEPPDNSLVVRSWPLV